MRLWLVLFDGRPLAPDFDNRSGLKTTADIREDGLAPASTPPPEPIETT